MITGTRPSPGRKSSAHHAQFVSLSRQEVLRLSLLLLPPRRCGEYSLGEKKVMGKPIGIDTDRTKGSRDRTDGVVCDDHRCNLHSSTINVMSASIGSRRDVLPFCARGCLKGGVGYLNVIYRHSAFSTL